MTEVDSRSLIRVGMVHGAWPPDGIRILFEGRAKVFVPIDGTSGEAEHLSSILTQNLKTSKEIQNISENISYHIMLLKSIFKYASENYNSVSENFQVAVHTNKGEMLVTHDISDNTTIIEYEHQ